MSVNADVLLVNAGTSGQVENVTMRVLALKGFHCVLHHTATFAALNMACETGGDAAFQHGCGGDVLSVEAVKLYRTSCTASWVMLFEAD